MNNYDYPYENMGQFTEETNTYNMPYDYMDNARKDYMKKHMPEFMSSNYADITPYNMSSNYGSLMPHNNSGQGLNTYKGFIRGNIFENLYDPYLNYKESEIRPTNERQHLLCKVQEYNFAMIDLNFYLDNHPNDSEMIKVYNNCCDMYKEAVNQYERKFGPLTTDSKELKNQSWNWDNGPWPWEVI